MTPYLDRNVGFARYDDVALADIVDRNAGNDEYYTMDVTTVVAEERDRSGAGRPRTLLRSFDGVTMRLSANVSWYMYTSEIRRSSEP